MPAIAQLVEHLTVEICSYQIVPGSIPSGRILHLQRPWRWYVCTHTQYTATSTNIERVAPE